MRTALVAARAAQIIALSCVTAAAFALKAHRPLIFAACVLGLVVAVAALLVVNLLRGNDLPRRHSPWCDCPEHENH